MDKRCVKCGAELAPAAQVCPFCGSEQDGEGYFDDWDDNSDIYEINPESEDDLRQREALEMQARKAKRKRTTILVTSILSLCVVLIAAVAVVGTHYFYHVCGDGVTWSLTDNTLTVSGTGAMYDADRCRFRTESDKIEKVKIENGVTSVGAEVFKGFSNLKSVSLGNNVKRIGSNAFESCGALEKITVANFNTTYDSRDGVLFAKDGKELVLYPSGKDGSSYTVPSGVTTIDASAFSSSPLTEITVPQSVTEIESNAFNAKSSVYYEGTKSGWNSIKGTSQLSGVSVCCLMMCGENASWSLKNGTLTISGSGAIDDFDDDDERYYNADADKIQKVVIEYGITSIGDGAFSNLKKLSSVSIPSSVTTIGTDAFSNCVNLTSITLPESVTKVEFNAFSGCSGLEKAVYESFDAFKNTTLASGNDVLTNNVYFADGTHLIESVTTSQGNHYDIDIGTLTHSGYWRMLAQSYTCVSFDLTYQLTEITEGNPYGTFDIYILKSNGTYEKVSSISVTSKKAVTTRVTLDSATSIKGVTLMLKDGKGRWKGETNLSNLVVKN